MLNRRSINVLFKVSAYESDNYFYVFNRKGQIILFTDGAVRGKHMQSLSYASRTPWFSINIEIGLIPNTGNQYVVLPCDHISFLKIYFISRSINCHQNFKADYGNKRTSRHHKKCLTDTYLANTF